MEYRILGPLEVVSGDEVIDIRRGIPRLLLLALLVRVGEAMTPDALAELIWGDEQPANPANALQTQVSYLRKSLATGSPDRQPLVTRAGSYVLDVPPVSVDAVRFQRAVERARHNAEARTTAALTAAVEEFDEALSMWRGDALAESGGQHFAMAEAARLDELRINALEVRAECLLDLGRHRDAAVELRGLVLRHPLRERLYEMLMLSQYRSGQQADALRTYDSARSVLLDELGLDPGPGLQRMQQLVLEQSPELAWTAPADADPVRDSPARTSAAEGPTAPRRQLPASLGGLIGRESDIRRVSELLDRSRLVTLTGPGGAGKTSLAVEVARRTPMERSAWFVDLDGVSDDALVALATAAVLGSPTQPGTDPIHAMAAALGDEPGLLVLDTCEHVIEGAARLASGLLGECPDLRVLATSRRQLMIRGEVAWPVPPLGLPEPETPLHELDQVPAVALFIERASAVRSDFVLSPQNAADVSAICVALDGLPLALELAAARASALSPRAIRERLDDRFTLLVDGGRDAAERQQTLRSAIDWSFDLLSDEERTAFIRLCAFAGPFGLDEVMAVVASDVGDPVSMLSALVRQSMVSVIGDDRYQVLDTPREYGREHLAASPNADVVRERHARYYVGLAAVAADGIWSGKQADYLRRVRAAMPNIRAAIEWSFGNDQDELAARIVGSLSWFFMLEGMSTEAIAYLDRALGSAQLSLSTRAGVLYGQGLLTAPLGRLDDSRESCTESVRLAREVGDRRATAAGLAALSVTEWASGELEQAAAHQDEAIELYALAGDKWRLADITVLRARTAIDQRDPKAHALLEDVIPVARRLGDLHAAGMALGQLSAVKYAAGEHRQALDAAAEALAAHEALDEPEATAGALHLLGRAQLAVGDVDGARSSHSRALTLATAIGHIGALCEALEDFAALALVDRDVALARALLTAAARERVARGIRARPIELDHIEDLRHRIDAAAGEGSSSSARPSSAELPFEGLSFEEALDLLRSSVGTAPQQRSS